MWALLVGCVRPNSGPEAKMRDLAEAFNELGYRTHLEVMRPGATVPRRVAALLQQVAAHPPPGRGLVLLRSHWSMPGALPAMRRLRASGCAVVIDVPTPVGAGVREILRAPRPAWSKAGRLLAEATWSPLAWSAADLVVQYAPDAAPWRTLAGNRRLTLTNGVDVKSRPVSAGWVDRDGITFVCAGALGPWHGLDRLLYGMAATPGDDSNLLVVGDGPELPKLRAICAHRGLSGRVSFLGSLGGADLDRVMARADVGVASLGEHRRGGWSLSPLKTRDYLARGLPVLFAGDDPDLRDDPPFTLRLADDDSEVAMSLVRPWLAALRAEARGSSWPAVSDCGPAGIRLFAERHLQWHSRALAISEAVE